MAEPSPGQIITPGGNPSEPPKQPPQPVQEVSVDLSHPVSVAPPSPVPTTPTVQPPQSITPPPVASQPIPQPPVVPIAAPSSPAPSDVPPAPIPSTPEVPSPQPEEPIGGFAPQFDLGSPAPPLPEDTYQFETPDTISWTASEYIAHQKESGWYLALAGATVLLAAFVYFITHGDIISVGVIVFAGIVFGVYAAKTPKEQHYAIAPTGITVGSKTYGFDQLKTFSITDEGAFSSITFWPLKRFMPAISIYYAPDDEDKIVQVLSNYLPFDSEKRDAVDSFMRKIRF